MKKIYIFTIVLLIILMTGCGEKTYINIKGNSEVTHSYGEEYKDEGYELLDKNVKVTVDNDIDVNKLGEQQVIYIVLDKDKEVERKVRIVNVVDNKGPEIDAQEESEIFIGSTVDDDAIKKAINLKVKDNYCKEEDIKVELSYEIDNKTEGDYKVTIKAIDTNNNESKKEVTVKVAKVHITKITVSKTSLSLSVGGTYTITVKYSPKNATDSKTLVWTSTDSSIAKVSKGKVTALKTGSATICAELKSNSKIKSCSSVKVSLSPVDKLKKFLVEQAGYTKMSSTLYQKKGNGLTLKINFSNKTFVSDDGYGPLTYYYKQNKAQSIYKYSNGAVKTFNYNYSNGEHTCYINPSAYAALCYNSNAENSIINSLKSLKNLFLTYTNGAGVSTSSL